MAASNSGNDPENTTTPEAHRNFIQVAIDSDLDAAGGERRVVTRFPPEPNGYLHIGHAKAICLSHGIALEYGGQINLRFDDTNPSAEETEFVEAIQDDVRWLGVDWGEHLYFTSDYFGKLHGFAVELIHSGDAYVCDLTQEQTREYRGTVTKPGKNSPFRERSVEENLDLFARMKAGEFPDGARTLRAKIDVSSPNMNMRDPVMYRISHTAHHRTGDEWCIYPMYDWAHGQSDAIEDITHSLCTLEFENHRPLYDWFLEHLPSLPHPRQIEFARLNLTYAITSKRKLTQLVKGGHVSGWDDPRMPTIRGLRRRGYTPESIRNFCDRIGIAKFNSTVDMVQLENAVRDDLNKRAPRAMGVLNPVRLVIENYPEGQEEFLEAVNSPEDPSLGTRKVPFSRVLYIEREDFREEAPRKYFRMTPGREVRLRYAYYVTCTGFETDPESGEVTEVRCTYDPETKGGDSADGRKVKGTIHWVSAQHAARAEIRIYDHLFNSPTPLDVPEGEDLTFNLNPESLVVLEDRPIEPSLAEPGAWETFQLERKGYFCVDCVDSRPGKLVLNRTVALRDSWAKLEKKSR
ncbi:MAG: glutaminyl-tRNA synthetase [Chlamydiales bacterium]|jgi:glutaminyl-tRNA synthetase